MAEGIKIRQLDPTSELEPTDVFVIDRVSQVDSTVSVTQNIKYSDMVERVSEDIDAFHPEDGAEYVILTATQVVEFDVTVRDKTENHRYYNYTDSNGTVASDKAFFLNELEAPFLILVPGITYKFNVFDATNYGYELKFYTTPNGDGLGGIDTDIKDPIVTRVGTPGAPDAHILLELEENEDQRIFYIDDNNPFMGNQIFDPGSDNAFETPDFGGGGGGIIFPPFTQDQYDDLVETDEIYERLLNDITQRLDENITGVDDLNNNVTAVTSSVLENETLIGNIKDDLQLKIDDTVNTINTNTSSILSIEVSQQTLDTKVDNINTAYMQADSDMMNLITSLQSKVQELETQLSKVIQVEE